MNRKKGFDHQHFMRKKMLFETRETLTEEEIQSGLRNVIKDGLASEAMVTLTGGVFLVYQFLSCGNCPILGGQLVDFFSGRELSMTLKWIGPGNELAIPTLNLRQWDFFFFLAFFIGLYSIHRLAMVKEEGEVKEKIIIREFLSEVRGPLRNFSSIHGLRLMVQSPFTVLKHSRIFSRRNSIREKRKKDSNCRTNRSPEC